MNIKEDLVGLNELRVDLNRIELGYQSALELFKALKSKSSLKEIEKRLMKGESLL